MNQPDISSQTNESPKSACVVNTTTRTLSAEQMRLWLNDRRNNAQEVRRGLLREAARLKDEVATIDALLTELTIG